MHKANIRSDGFLEPHNRFSRCSPARRSVAGCTRGKSG